MPRKAKEGRPLILKNGEVPVCLSTLCRHLPGTKVCYETIRSWCTEGLESRLGRVIVMESIQGTNGRLSSIEAYQRFIMRLNEDE
jgi:hypothetical protein